MVKGQGHWNFTSFHGKGLSNTWSTCQKWWLFLVEVVWTHSSNFDISQCAQAYPLHCITKNWLKWLNFAWWLINRTTHVCAAAPSVVSVRLQCGMNNWSAGCFQAVVLSQRRWVGAAVRRCPLLLLLEYDGNRKWTSLTQEWDWKKENTTRMRRMSSSSA